MVHLLGSAGASCARVGAVASRAITAAYARQRGRLTLLAVLSKLMCSLLFLTGIPSLASVLRFPGPHLHARLVEQPLVVAKSQLLARLRGEAGEERRVQ